MKPTFRSLLQSLTAIAGLFDPESAKRKTELLRQLHTVPLPDGKLLAAYAQVLLYLSAHPADASQARAAEAGKKRIAAHLRNTSAAGRELYLNSGLPYAPISCTFSHDILAWLILQRDFTITAGDFDDSSEALNDALKVTLPRMEREYTAFGYSAPEMMDALRVPERNRAAFIIRQFAELDLHPQAKDLLFDKLGIEFTLRPKNQELSRAFNRVRFTPTFYHDGLLKKFDHVALLNAELPAPAALTPAQEDEIIRVMRYSLTLIQRETDPLSYMETSSLRVYHLERGISIAIYGMTPERQLPLETYVGYTLLKNGYPAAYGGAWIFGRKALFGINIFEAMRGGESGLMMCQLLRVYRQAFGVDYFEVEPYQYGDGNPEGIQSGAFWFYYRFGFRPLDSKLRKLAEDEQQKISTRKGYRSSEKTLLRFTESNIALNLGKGIPVYIPEIRKKVTEMISAKYGGDRLRAILACAERFTQRSGLSPDLDEEAADWLLAAEAMKWTHHRQTALIAELIHTRAFDIYDYQKLLLDLL